MKTLGIAMIVKNEEEMLPSCLESIKDADEIIIVDTGSTDKTIEIAKRYTDKVYNFPWISDFAAARNYALSKCTTDWIMSIDADHELITPISEVKKLLESVKEDAASLKSISTHGWHWRKVFILNGKGIKWVGKVHENLNTISDIRLPIERKTGYSKNHYLDRERNLKILLTMEKTSRTLFYIAREYTDLKKYKEALENYDAYMKLATWLPEKAEAYYYKAKCLWMMNEGEEARISCLKAININADMKKALLFMAEMSWEKNKKKWLEYAELATNEDVIFK